MVPLIRVYDFVGFNNDDTHEIIDRLVEKVIHLRVFEDENQK